MKMCLRALDVVIVILLMTLAVRVLRISEANGGDVVGTLRQRIFPGGARSPTPTPAPAYDPNGDLYKPPSGVDVASQSWMGAGGAPKRRAAPRRAASRPRPKSSSSSSSSRKSNDKKSSDEGRSSRRGSSDDTRVRPSRSRARQIRRTVERYWKKGDTARITIAGQRYVRTRAGSRGSRPRAGARAYAISADDAKKMKKAAPKGGRGLKMVPAPLAHPTGSRSSIRQGKLGHRDAVRVNRG